MKKNYAEIKAEKIEFGAYDMVTTYSIPDSCIQIVADLKVGDQVCTNPGETIQYLWVNDNPYGD